MKSILFSILAILFCVIACALDLAKVYAESESGLSQNCGIYGQADMFTKEQIQEMNAVILRSSKEINLNIVFYLTDKDLTGREAGSIYYETVGATEGLIYSWMFQRIGKWETVWFFMAEQKPITTDNLKCSVLSC